MGIHRGIHCLAWCLVAFYSFFFTAQAVAQTVATPVLSPTSGLSYAQFNVTVTDTTSGSTIYYTLTPAGTTPVAPTTSSPTVTSGGTILISQSETLEVYAVKSGYTASVVTSATYHLTGQVVGGFSHSVALRTDGTVWAWGLNSSGQLGNNTTTNSYSPAQVLSNSSGTPLSGVVQVAAGNYHSVALMSNGTVWDWGINSNGELGHGTTTQSNLPVEVIEGITGSPNLTNVIAISAGAYFTLALKSDGTVWAWGTNGDGQLGNGTTTQSAKAVQVTGLSGVTIVDIAAGYYHALALDSAGKVWAWGYNNDGQIGDTTNTQRQSPVAVYGLGASSGVVQLAAGAYHSMVLKSTGEVDAWGLNTDGQLGDTTTTTRTSPVQVSGYGSGSAVTSIEAGGYHSLAIESNGATVTAWAWGNNDFGQLGYGTVQNLNAPTQITELTGTPVGLGAGDSHTFVVESNGAVWFCGRNEYGQAGDGTGDRINPVQVLSLGPVSSIDAHGGFHGLATMSNGQLWAFGENLHGELGNNSSNEEAGPQQVPLTGPGTSYNILSASSGQYFSLALDQSGNAYSWGYNSDGELGYSGGSTTSLAKVSPLPSPLAALCAAANHSMALDGSGNVWTWGYNPDGELGNGSSTTTHVPGEITSFPSGTQIQSITVGEGQSFAIDTSKNLWAWGYNVDGQVGVGSTSNVLSPTKITSLSGSTLAAAGGQYFSLALDTSNHVWTWGSDGNGQLGDGSTTQETSPEHITSLDPSGGVSVTAVDAGFTHGLVLKSDKSVWVWGLNADGQLGDGTMTSESTPEQVPGLTGIVALSAGADSTLALKEDGTVVAWGNDSWGQLGVGANYSLAAPLPGLNLLANTPLPTVSITSPSNNSSGAMGTYVTLTASASETSGTIASVSYYIDTYLVGTSTSSSAAYSVSWIPPTWGNFTFTAIATDTNGNTSYLSAPVTVVIPYDSDGNGLPDWWEIHYFGHIGNNPNSSPDGNGFTLLQDYLNGSDPTNYYSQNGSIIAPTLFIISGNGQLSSPGAFADQPLVVSVTNSSGGALLTHAPLTFTVASGGGLVAATPTSSTGSAISLTTNTSGQAQVYYQSPSGTNVASSITANAAGHSATFTVTTTAGNGTFDAPTNITTTSPSATEIDLTWVNHASTATGIVIEESTDNVNWTTIATLSNPGATSYAVTSGLTVGQTYYFGVAATK